MSTLEQRITAAMTAPIASADLTVLIGDVENSLAAAIANAQEHAKSALDITAGDGNEAFEESQKHDLISKRLQVCVPRLQDRLVEMLNAERCAAWIAEAEKLRPARDAANNLLSEHVPKLARQLVEYLQTIKTTAEAVSNLNVQAPPGYHLDAVDPAKLIAKFVVPSMQQGGKQLWPVRTFDPSLFAPSAIVV